MVGTEWAVWRIVADYVNIADEGRVSIGKSTGNGGWGMGAGVNQHQTSELIRNTSDVDQVTYYVWRIMSDV